MGSIGGIARLATVVAEIRDEKESQSEPLLLLSGGDFIGGSPFAWLILKGEALELQLM